MLAADACPSNMTGIAAMNTRSCSMLCCSSCDTTLASDSRPAITRMRREPTCEMSTSGTAGAAVDTTEAGGEGDEDAAEALADDEADAASLVAGATLFGP